MEKLTCKIFELKLLNHRFPSQSSYNPRKSDCIVKYSLVANIAMLKQCSIHTERVLHCTTLPESSPEMNVCLKCFTYRITPQRAACRYRVRETMCRYTPGYTGMPV